MAVRNFFWLFESSIAGSGRPGGEVGRHSTVPAGMTLAESLNADLDWLTGQGIGAILSLTEDPLMAEPLRQRGIVSLHLPIPDQAAPTPQEFLAAIDFIDQQRVAGRGVLTHCRIGEGRTGSILAAYLIRQGATYEQALAQLRAVRSTAISSPEQQAALVAFARQREWII